MAERKRQYLHSDRGYRKNVQLLKPIKYQTFLSSHVSSDHEPFHLPPIAEKTDFTLIVGLFSDD